jgi:hypothetical protein
MAAYIFQNYTTNLFPLRNPDRENFYISIFRIEAQRVIVFMKLLSWALISMTILFINPTG